MDKGGEVEKFLLGNEAIARGALEAGVEFAAGYPGTPASEIIEVLAKHAKQTNLYVEWSTNEKVAAEGAAAAAIAGLRSIAAMKNAGLSVALDFLTHLSLTGLGDATGSMEVVVCDDPGAHSSGDETDSRWLAKFAYAPLLEPGSTQEAYQMAREAHALSEKYRCYVVLRSYTRLSHASSLINVGEANISPRKAGLNHKKCLTPYLAKPKHAEVLKKLSSIEKEFERSPFNQYLGPDNPKLVVVASGSAVATALESIELLGVEGSVGLLKLATLWPFPRKFVQGHLKAAPKILVVEEVDPFVEYHVKEALYEIGGQDHPVYGKLSGHVPEYGEIDPERTLSALCEILDIKYVSRTHKYTDTAQKAAREILIDRGLTWCPGCPHRATFWSLEKALKGDKRGVYVTGDIGCYTLDVFPEGKCQMNLLHAMGSGVGLASGLGQLSKFGCSQPIISICGDSTFFHAAVPGLINAVYNKSNMVLIVLDNHATAMTGLQTHPGTKYNAVGEQARPIDIGDLCRSLGASVEVTDPFNIKVTTSKIRELLRLDEGVRVLIVQRSCELLRKRTQKSKPFNVRVDDEKCRGEKCGICYGAYRCPALSGNPETGKAQIREEVCSGCGVCMSVCPSKSITREVAEL